MSSSLLPALTYYLSSPIDLIVKRIRLFKIFSIMSTEQLYAEVEQELEKVGNDPSITLDVKLLDKFGLQVGRMCKLYSSQVWCASTLQG